MSGCTVLRNLFKVMFEIAENKLKCAMIRVKKRTAFHFMVIYSVRK